ncbi:MAG: substrate-binding domain-containing protein, partial [Muribaculaceae bacterium]|nr:substrate-binding domain-containing protein [Muribaculaceae bacterium]
ARQTLRDADTCLMKVNDLSNLLTGTLDIGVTYSFSPILTETILGFMKAYPQVKLNIYYKPMAELMEMLKNRMVDFALAFRPTSDDPEIESHVLFDNHLAVIVSQDHTLSTLSGVNLRELEKWPLALPARGLQARNAFESLAEASASAFKIKIELNEVNILLELIKNSRLVTVLAEATVYNAKGIKAIPLILPLNRMDGCVHMLRDCYRKKSAIKFIEMLKDSAAVRARVKDWFR